MIVSRLSCFFSGAKSTSLEEQGIAGQTAEIVVSSWIEKLGGASRRVALRMPPGFGVSAEFAAETGRTAKSAQTKSLQLGLFIADLLLPRSLDSGRAYPNAIYDVKLSLLLFQLTHQFRGVELGRFVTSGDL